MRITAQVGKASADGFTRSNPLGDADAQTKFNKNDEISVKADDQEAVTYQYDGSEWLPKESGKFLKWENKTMTFTAYYPATFNGTITQPTEYTSLKSLAAADFMSFTGEQSNTNGNNLMLTMNRLMARVVVEVVGFNDQYDKKTPINSVTICGVTAYKHMDDGKFYALIKPTEAQSTSEFLSLKVGANNAKETLTGIPTLEAGKSYTYELTVGKNKISVSGITVKDWTTGETIPGGKAEYFPYVTFKADAEQKFSITAKNGYQIPNLEYSVNNGKWATVVADTEIPFGGANGNLRLRGTGNTNGTSSADTENMTENTYGYSKISFSNNAEVECEGDIRTLLDYRTYKTVNTNEARFFRLFYACGQLISAPDLPATNLAKMCYSNMFEKCYNFKNAPDLPATTLVQACYMKMFCQCESLSKAPDLPATNLAKSCYANMFNECWNLTSAPKLPATTLVEGCYYNMFYNCTSLTSAPELRATTLANICYYNMFYNCKNLTSAPELPAKVLASNCYRGMFFGCTKISAITMLAPKSEIETKSDCTYTWLKNAGTGASSRILKVQDADAYNALESIEDYLPAIWKKDAEGTIVKYKVDEEKNIE